MVSGKIITGIVLLILVFTGVYMFIELGNNPVNTVRVIDNPQENSITGNVVEITSSGFEPKELTINQGEAVTFINKDIESHWPASDNHPTHTIYPGSDITICFNGSIEEKSKIFDSCRGLEQGETYSFTFDEIGSWVYHDHKQSDLVGTIVVK